MMTMVGKIFLGKSMCGPCTSPRIPNDDDRRNARFGFLAGTVPVLMNQPSERMYRYMKTLSQNRTGMCAKHLASRINIHCCQSLCVFCDAPGVSMATTLLIYYGYIESNLMFS